MVETKAAASNFLNALEKIPSLIEQYQKKNEVYLRDIPTLQEIVSSLWKKEDELKQLKPEAAVLERKIQLSLAPTTEVAEQTNNQGTAVEDNVKIEQESTNRTYRQDYFDDIKRVAAANPNRVILTRPDYEEREKIEEPETKIPSKSFKM